jgi:hypothetical protein
MSFLTLLPRKVRHLIDRDALKLMDLLSDRLTLAPMDQLIEEVAEEERAGTVEWLPELSLERQQGYSYIGLIGL